MRFLKVIANGKLVTQQLLNALMPLVRSLPVLAVLVLTLGCGYQSGQGDDNIVEKTVETAVGETAEVATTIKPDTDVDTSSAVFAIEPVYAAVITGQIIAQDSGSSELPAGADVVVKLLDVSLADASAKVLATYETTITEANTVATAGKSPFPIDYVLPFNREEIIEGMSYSISARIELDGKLLYINDTSIPVLDTATKIAQGQSKVDLPVIAIQ